MVPVLHPGDASARSLRREGDLEQLSLREGAGHEQASAACEAGDRVAHRSSPRASDRER